MNEQTILSSPSDAKRKMGIKRVDPTRAWALLGWVGFAFLVVGGADFALTWYPMDFGNREWEFGTVTASFNGLPILVLGLGLLYAAALGYQRRWWGGVTLLVSAVLMLWVLGGVVIWATNVPLALQSVPLEMMTGIKKALVKTTIQSVAYPVILGFLAVRSFQLLRGGFEE
ncbi:MAG: hypothetical protein ACWGSQ_03430 [Longimicrobiales bacterium]